MIRYLSIYTLLKASPQVNLRCAWERTFSSPSPINFPVDGMFYKLVLFGRQGQLRFMMETQ